VADVCPTSLAECDDDADRNAENDAEQCRKPCGVFVTR
jgi:hypothetical protein